jgi:ankyrin repeat protein
MGFLSRLFEDGFHLAVKRGDIGKVKQLLADGRDPKEKRRQKTPLMIAARSANVEATTLLLENGVELEAQDRQGSTALMLAAGGWGYKGKDKEEKCLEVVKALLKKGADPNACGKRGQTAMRYALGAGNRRVMTVLHGHGAADSCCASVSMPEFSGAEPLASN